MSMFRIRGLFLGALSLLAAGAVASDAGKGQIRFNRDIKPILAENCFACHGADPAARKGKLRLDREEGFFKDRQDGPTVVKGKPEASPLYKRILSTDPEEIMPPPKSHKTLKPEQKELIKKWIAQGAPWEAHWSFIKPEVPPTPKVKSEKWVRNAIDTYVLAKLDAAGLKPAPEADRYTLARRLSLDLTGLPPEPAMVEEFVNDKSADAYEKYVDKLFESPRYGENRARFWLDAARYADTHGLHFDNFREIWPYRDWVINAFNKNQPFDQFTVEQLAGDLLPNPTKDQIIATGFHRCAMTTNEGGTIAEENICNYARERVETTSWVFLGLTANCCVCHDHKFDPLTQKDFYSMSAFFRNTTQGAMDGNIRDTPPVMIVSLPADEKRLAEIPNEISAAQAAAAEKRKALRADFDKWVETAKPADWDAMLAKGGAPAFHFPLNEEKAGNEAPGTSAGGAVAAKSSQPLKWEEGGKLGKALVIVDKAPIELPATAGDFEKDQGFSYGCWVKFPKEFKGSGAVLARMDDQADYRGWDLWVQDNEFGAHVVSKWAGDDAFKVVTTGNQRKAATWQHVFITYDGSGKAEGMKIFVDGKAANVRFEKNNLKSTIKTTTPLLIGQRKTSSPLPNVAVQDVRLYTRKLAGPEVLRLATVPKVHAALAKEAKDRTAKEKDEIFDAYVADSAELVAASEKVATLEAEKKAIRDRSPVAHIMEEKKGSTPMASILARGEYDKPKEKVEAGVFAALHPYGDLPKNRLGLAKWLVSPENPLMARVIVNRFWQEVFGTGIVKTAEDFGIMGEAPANPELLEYLACEFRDGGWDVKKLFKLMVTSATYRQSAQTTKDKVEKDPNNRLLSRGPRFRLDAELLRDYALAASGELSPKIGGPSVKPYQPDGVWEIGMPDSNTHIYKRDSGEALYRRSMYTFWKRAAPPASMDILNAPSRETSCVRRERTNTPLQALVTLNDPQFIEAARYLAQNAMKNGGADEASRLNFIARRILCRPLSAQETSVVKQVETDLLAHYKAKPDDAKALLAVGESKPDATLDAAELAAWTMVSNQLLNLDEVLNK